MNNTIQLVAETDQHAVGLARAVGAFLSAEASGLTEILETVGEFDAAEAVRHLTELCQAPQADAGHIAGTLDEVLDGLLHIPFLLIDRSHVLNIKGRSYRLRDLEDPLKT